MMHGMGHKLYLFLINYFLFHLNLANLHFHSWRLIGEFITTLQQRRAAIIKARKLSSALSAASSAVDHIRDWVLGTPEVGSC